MNISGCLAEYSIRVKALDELKKERKKERKKENEDDESRFSPFPGSSL